MIWLKNLIYKLIDFGDKLFENNKYYHWYVSSKICSRGTRKGLEDFWYHRTEPKDATAIRQYDSCVISIFDGGLDRGGLADRLRGIISAYSIAREKGLQYRIYFQYPFPLEEYWIPNSYDWRIDEEDICRDANNVKIVTQIVVMNSEYHTAKQRQYLRHHIKPSVQQIHVYTNADFSYQLDFATMFHELFQPSPRLQNAINREKAIIGGKYISVSCRFRNLLEDFNETCPVEHPLSEERKREVLDKIERVVMELKDENPGCKVLMNSDSVTFLGHYKTLDYAYVIPGNVTHIDAKDDEYSYEKFEKTFLDFMMISYAERVYLIKSEEMMNSGFPYAAARAGKKKFEEIII